MERRERKKAFKEYLIDIYRPYLLESTTVFDANTSISRSLCQMEPGLKSIFDVTDSSLLLRLQAFIENPQRGRMAYGRPVRDIDVKRAFFKHYIGFLSKQSESEDDPNDEYVEGQVKEIQFFRRKRSKTLRDACIKKYGSVCYVCGFDFEAHYGPRGHNYIEVHHLNPMANYDEEHSITIDDLRPLCSNCHSMIHRDPVSGITDIEAFIIDYKSRNI